MNQNLTRIVAPFLLLFVCGCSSGNRLPTAAEQALQDSADFELLSLEPNAEKTEGNVFHGWNVLGATPIKDSEIRQKLISHFKAGVAENDGRVAACFAPRHGIKSTNDGKTYEFVICFECYQVQWYIDGQRSDGFLITDSPQPTFDEILKDENIPLAKKPRG